MNFSNFLYLMCVVGWLIDGTIDVTGWMIVC